MRVYPVTVEGDDVFVDVTRTVSAAAQAARQPAREGELNTMSTLEIRDLHVSVETETRAPRRSCAAST